MTASIKDIVSNRLYTKNSSEKADGVMLHPDDFAMFQREIELTSTTGTRWSGKGILFMGTVVRMHPLATKMKV